MAAKFKEKYEAQLRTLGHVLARLLWAEPYEQAQEALGRFSRQSDLVNWRYGGLGKLAERARGAIGQREFQRKYPQGKYIPPVPGSSGVGWGP